VFAALTLLLLLAQAAQPTTADGWTAAGWRALRAGSAEDLGNGMTFEDAFERAALMPYSAFKDTWR
jgi:hypothetical protein